MVGATTVTDKRTEDDPSSMLFSHLETLRTVGLLEKLSTTRHLLGYYYNVAASASYSIQSDPGPLPALVHHALAAVINHHPILAAIPIGEDTSTPYFARLERIDLDAAVTFIGRETAFDDSSEVRDEQLERLLEEQHNTNFKHCDLLQSSPFWRLLILHDPALQTRFTAIFVIHHALADGLSCLAFHRSFHAALPTTMPSVSTTTIQPPRLPLPLPLESLHSLPLTPFYLLRAFIDDLLPSRSRISWTGSPICAPTDTSPAHTNLSTHLISARVTTRLLSLCHINSTTLTSTLQTLFSHVLFSILPVSYTTLTSTIPISLRLILSPALPQDAMGVYVSRHLATHHRPAASPSASTATATFSANASEDISTSIWPAARAARAALAADMASNGTDTPTALLRWAGDLRARYLAMANKPRECSFEVSNIGIWRAPTPGREVADKREAGRAQESDGTRQHEQVPSQRYGVAWRPGRLLLSQSADVAGAAIVMSMATGADGRLGLAFSWLDGVVERDFVRGVISTFLGSIVGLVNSPGSSRSL